MKQFACGAVVPGCHQVFHGETDDQILTAVADHARDDHGLTEVSPELAAAVRAHIAEVATPA